MAQVAGGDAEHNAAVTQSVLSGEPGAAGDIVVLNAAAALTVPRVTASIEDGLLAASESIDPGPAAGVITRWVEASNAP